MSTTPGAQTIERAFRLLRLIARRGFAGMKLSELTHLMGLPHPTVHRLLKALISEGAVVQDSATRRYRLGSVPFHLGLSSRYSIRVVERFRPTLERLAKATDDTIYLVLRSGFDAVCLDRLDARTPIRTANLEVGDWRPLGVGAAGTALLAALPDPEFEACIAANAREFKLYGDLTEEEVRERATSARQDGYGFTSGNLTVGVSALGMAIPTTDGVPVLGISVAAITDRVNARTELIKQALFDEVTKVTFTIREEKLEAKLI